MSSYLDRATKSRLQDNISHAIYSRRISYAAEGDIEHLYNMVREQREYRALLRTIEIKTAKQNCCDVVIYGAGEWGCNIYGLISRDVKVSAFIDNGNVDIDTCIPVYKYSELTDKDKNIYLIAIKSLGASIKNELMKDGISEDSIIVLDDYMTYDLYVRQYFDLSEANQRIGDEVYIDAGVFDGLTIDNFIESRKGQYAKVIGFEPSNDACRKYLSKYDNNPKIEIIQAGLGSESGTVGFATNYDNGAVSRIDPDSEDVVNITTIDEVLSGDRVDFIKMDIEGMELEALKGAEQSIKKWHPTLAICVYHKPEDIVTIPEYILSLYDGYKLYLRQYSLLPSETVLYAIANRLSR